MSCDAGAATSRMTLDVGPFRQGMLQAHAIAQTFPPVVSAFMASPLLGVASLAKQAGGTLAGALSAGLGGGLKVAADAEQARVAFEVLMGSAERARKMLGDLARFAAETPFKLPEVVNTGRQLLDLGYANEKVMPTLKAIGDVAAGASVPLEQLGLVFAQVVNKTSSRARSWRSSTRRASRSARSWRR